MSSSNIDNLPEPIISHVLGYLPIRDAVRTSVLARQWKHRWRSVENLNVDDDVLLDYKVASIIMQLKFTLLRKIKFRCRQPHQITIINDLIRALLSRHVRELDLDISWAEISSLPREIFTSDTLVLLKLRVYVLDVPAFVHLPNLKVLRVEDTKFKDDKSISRLLYSCPVLEELALISCTAVLDVPVFVHLPNLKVLRVEDMKFKDDESISRLLYSCPVLEELALVSCSFDNKFTLQISKPTLKKLILYHIGNYEVKYSIVLDTPELAYLEFADYIPNRCKFKNLKSFVGARVDFDTKIAKARSDDTKFAKARSDDTKFVKASSDDTKFAKARSDDTKFAKARSDDTKFAKALWDDTKFAKERWDDACLHLSADYTKACVRVRIRFSRSPTMLTLKKCFDYIHQKWNL